MNDKKFPYKDLQYHPPLTFELLKDLKYLFCRDKNPKYLKMKSKYFKELEKYLENSSGKIKNIESYEKEIYGLKIIIDDSIKKDWEFVY